MSEWEHTQHRYEAHKELEKQIHDMGEELRKAERRVANTLEIHHFK